MHVSFIAEESGDRGNLGGRLENSIMDCTADRENLCTFTKTCCCTDMYSMRTALCPVVSELYFSSRPELQIPWLRLTVRAHSNLVSSGQRCRIVPNALGLGGLSQQQP